MSRDGELRYRQAEVGDADRAVRDTGRPGGPIDAVEPAADVVARIVDEADRLLRAAATRR